MKIADTLISDVLNRKQKVGYNFRYDKVSFRYYYFFLFGRINI